VAFSLSNNMRAAVLIVLGEIGGSMFDWANGRWAERN
jgi:hypothetical protein